MSILVDELRAALQAAHISFAAAEQDLQRRISTAKEKTESLEAARATLEIQLATITERGTSLEESLAKSESECRARELEILDLHGQLDQASEQIAQLKGRLDATRELEDQAQSLQRARSALETQLAVERSLVSDLKFRLSEARAAAAAAEIRLEEERLRFAKASARASVVHAKQMRSAVLEAFDRVKPSLLNADAHFATYRAAFVDVMDALHAMKKQIETRAASDFPLDDAPSQDVHNSVTTAHRLDAIVRLQDRSFVQAAYLEILGRPADPAGLQHHLARLRGGDSKIQLLRSLASSQEYQHRPSKVPGLTEWLDGAGEKPLGWVGRQFSRWLTRLCEPLRREIRATASTVNLLQDSYESQTLVLAKSIGRLEHALQQLSLRSASIETPLAGPERRSSIEAGSDALAFPLVLEFAYDRTAAPADIGLNDDSRQLALGFRRLELMEANTRRTIWSSDMNAAANPEQHALFGFGSPEEWGMWSVGGRSSLAIWPQGAVSSDLLLCVKGFIFHQALPGLEVEVCTSAGHAGSRLLVGTEDSYEVLLTKNASKPMFFGAISSVPAASNVSLKSDLPLVSIIILNFNKPLLSVLSSLAANGSSISVPYEILIVDNGSSEKNWALLESLNRVARLTRIPVNRFFGEGNNIGSEQARGQILLFLNNDAFLTPGCVDRLLDALTSAPRCGAVAPLFRYPDGRLQEAGAFVMPDGSSLQRGKADAEFDTSQLQPIEAVDYGSAACLMLTREVFERLGGFNYRYDPAYYEDTDLCLRVKLLDLEVCLIRDAVCVHIENATTADRRAGNVPSQVVELNRLVFMSTWARYLATRDRSDLPVALLPAMTSSPATTGPITQLTFSPYPLVPGGGERYLLAAATAMAGRGLTGFATPDVYSQLRLHNILTDLGLPVGTVIPIDWATATSHAIDRFVLMGNEALPRRPPVGRASFFHCQFPFPWDPDPAEIKTSLEWLEGYRAVIVNSEFTKLAYEQALARYGVSKPVRIVYPPVAASRLLRKGSVRRAQVLSIGRFTDDGHAKRQDVLISAWKAAPARVRSEWTLVLCGSIPNNQRAKDYFDRLRKEAEGENVEFVVSPSRHRVDELLLESSVYAHATGFEVISPDEHWKCEHFGITIAEAIAAGCQTFAYAIGGAREILTPTEGGRLFSSIEELSAMFGEMTVGELPWSARQEVERLFGDAAFKASLEKAMGESDE